MLATWWLQLGPGIVALALVYVLIPGVKRLAPRVGAMDVPAGRKVHWAPMPRLGGLGIYLGFTGAVLLTRPWTAQLAGLLLGGTIITMVGVLDDIKGLSPRVKLAGQVLAALALLPFGIEVDFLTNPWHGMIALGALSAPVTILWVVGVTNALNLIDGLDGLAAGTAVLAAVTMAVIAGLEGQLAGAALAVALAGAALGFLRYNFYPAQIFMGDSGSMFLGYNLAVLAVLGLTKGATAVSLFVPVVILGIPILDTAFAIVRRFLGGQPIFQPDKQHLHHRLMAMGLSHRQAVLAIYGVNLVLGGSAVLLTRLTTDQGMVILLGLTVVVLWAANRLGIGFRPVGEGHAGAEKSRVRL